MDAERSQVPILSFFFSRVPVSPTPPPTQGKTSCLFEKKTYFSMPESHFVLFLFQASGYLPLNLVFFSPILKYIIVLIQTTVLYTTLRNK